MMIWLGLLLVCIGLTENTHLYVPLEQSGFAGLVVGMFILFWSMRRTLDPSFGTLAILVLAPLPLLITFACDVWPASLVSIAAALGLVPLARRKAPGLSMGLILAAGTTLILIAISWLYVVFSPHAKDLSFLSEPVAGCLRFLGHDAASANGGVFVRTYSEQISHLVSIDHVLPLPLVLMILGGAIILGMTRQWSLLPRLGLVCVLFVPVRYLFLLLVMLELEDKAFFWNEGWMLVSLVPLPVLLALFARFAEISPRAFAASGDSARSGELAWPSRFGQPALRFALLTFAAILSVAWLHWPEAGERKRGRILIDEGHSDWEWTTEPMDTLWYGKRSTYNFYCLAKYLGYYYKVEASHDTLTPDVLDQHDILVLKTPTVPFAEEEIDAIEHFVQEGGGLWLVGDHTNVFGTSSRLNPVARRFGLEFAHDVTYDLRHGGLNLYRPPTLEHPIVRHVQDFLFATSCSLRTSLAAQPVQIGTNLLTLPLDYAEHGFFPKTGRQAWESRFGSFVQTAAVRHGRGRVVAFSDSTCFSNFFMHVPGKPELAVGTMEWLDRRNRSPLLRLTSGLAALLLAAMALFLTLRSRNRQPHPIDVAPLCIAALLLGVGLGSFAVAAWSTAGYPWPEPRDTIPEILFEGERSRFFLPERQLIAGNEEEHFLTFYVWAQRLGLVPRVERSFQRTFENPELPVVMIRPQKRFSPSDVEHVRSYLERGGRLLVLDDHVVNDSPTNELLSAFGIRLVVNDPTADDVPRTLVDAAGRAVLAVPIAHEIHGARPILTTEDEARTVAVAHKEVGRGGILVCSFAYLFSGKHMGYTGSWPDPTQAKRFELEYWMLRAIESGDFSRPLDTVRNPPEYRRGSKLYLARQTLSSPGF